MRQAGFHTTNQQLAEDIAPRLTELLLSATEDVQHDAETVKALEQVRDLLAGIVRRELSRNRR